MSLFLRVVVVSEIGDTISCMLTVALSDRSDGNNVTAGAKVRIIFNYLDRALLSQGNADAVDAAVGGGENFQA